MKSKTIYFLGYISNKIQILSNAYHTMRLNKVLGGGKRTIGQPNIVKGLNNIIMEEPVNIGPGATIYTTGAKLIIKKHVISGPNLTIITGDHKYIVGRWLDSVTGEEKEDFYDQDVTIEEDVWIGANVTILKGVTIGRSSIIAAGSLIIKDVPPYSIVGGVPAKVIKMKWNQDDINKQEEFIRSNYL